MGVGQVGESFLACDVCVQFSKVWPIALVQAVGRFGEVGPRNESVGMFAQCWFLGTGVLGVQFCHICSTTLGDFHTQCLAKMNLFLKVFTYITLHANKDKRFLNYFGQQKTVFLEKSPVLNFFVKKQ